MPDASHPVTCPHCSTSYLLPQSLLGAAGARIKCPTCAGTFMVSAAGQTSVVAAEQPATEPAAAEAPQGEDALAIAFELVEAFATGREEEIATASREGRFFGEFGAEIVAVFDEFKQRAGRDASPAPFRQLLMERWGIELTPPPEPGD